MKRLAMLSAIGFSVAALAQGVAPTFEEVDGNADGQISRTEASLIDGADFDGMDTNQDGSVSREEYAAANEE